MQEGDPTPETIPEPAIEPASLLYGPAKPEEPKDEPPQVEDEPEHEPPSAEDEPPPEAEPGANEQEITSFSELLEHYQLDPDWAQNLKVQVKVNRKEMEVPFADLVKSYQIRQATEAELKEAKEKSKAITEELNQQKASLSAYLQILDGLIKEEESSIERDAKGTDWAKLREDDPAEYSARKAEVAERRERLQEKKQKALEAYQKANEVYQQQYLKTLAERLQTEHEKLIEKIPEWRDAEKAEAEKPKLAQYLIGQGFTQEEVSQAYDHRLVALSRKAMLYDEQREKSNSARKKVVKAPRVLKPGAKKPESPDKPPPTDRVAILYGG